MGSIICAIRGGPASQSTIRHAIELAKIEGKPLTFLYVVNLDFLSRTMKSRIHSISEDMRQMGELILVMASETALTQAVDADTVIREGDVVEQISTLCGERNADYVIVGEPLSKEKTAILNHEKIKSLGSELKRRCQAELVIVA